MSTACCRIGGGFTKELVELSEIMAAWMVSLELFLKASVMSLLRSFESSSCRMILSCSFVFGDDRTLRLFTMKETMSWILLTSGR